MTGQKLDLTGLTDTEAAHVLQVVQRDMRLRKKEEERLCELKQELDEESSRCLLLSRQTCFNQRCCIRCCSPFTFLLNPKRRCRDCSYHVCRACRVYNKRDRAWLCCTCQKSRLLKTQSLEWFYTNVKKRFKRFGSAKVLKTLYRKHLAEHSSLSELTEGSAYEESICNESSICGSDSTFYWHAEEHSMEETLSVATRVAEEAIDEAISNAEFDTSTQEKQNEACYLRQHRGELIEELAKTIVQKIISRRNALAEMKAEYDDSWPLEHAADLHHHHQPPCDRAPSCLKPDLWRSHVTFMPMDKDSSALEPDVPSALKKEGSGSAMTAWSVDRLDNSVLKSPDGNWIALQSAQLSRPTLLTQRKSLVYSALEKESRVMSAYEGLESDSESKPEPDSSWGAVLKEIHRKMMDSNLHLNDCDNSDTPLMEHRISRDDLFSDSEGNWKLALLKRKVPAEIRKPSSSRRTSIIDVNFNLTGDGESKEETKMAAEPETRKIRRSRKKMSKKAASSSVSDSHNKASSPLHPSDAGTPETISSGATTPEPFDPDSDVTGNGNNQTVNDFTLKLHEFENKVSDSPTGEAPDERNRTDEEEEEGRGQGRPLQMDVDVDGGRGDEEMNYRLYRLVLQSGLTDFSSSEDELDRAGQSEAERSQEKGLEEEDKEQKTERLTYTLCQLEKEAKASQFSSAEDELDRMGVEDKGEEDDGKKEDLAAKLCRLANEVDTTQFSSTEDELDKVGRGEDEEESMSEEMPWKLQPDKTQLCDLASLVSASQFSSTEDELDRAGEDRREEKKLWEGAESIGDIDMKMFELREDTEEREQRASKSLTQREDDETDVQRSRNLLEKRIRREAATHEAEVLDKNVELLEAEKELRTKQENYLEVNKTDDEPGANRTSKNEEQFPKDGERKWGTAAKSDEDAEFDRIISSMLLLSLEDMQVETLDKDGANGRKNELESDNGGESGFRKRAFDEKSQEASEKHVSEERSECAVKEYVQEETEGQLSTRDETIRSENVEEGHSYLTKEQLPGTTVKPALIEAEQPSPDEQKQEGRGSTTERAAAETRKDVYEDQTQDDTEQSSSSDRQGGVLSPEEIQNRYSAASLRNITTEMLKVLNATEDLMQGVKGGDDTRRSTVSLPPNSDPKKLDQQLWRLEENVYVAAGSVYSLEAELSDLEECARGICSSTSDVKLSFLEEQVAAAAARVQQSELQIGNISSRIAALKSAGLNVDPQSRFTKTPAEPAVTLDSSKHLRRRLPAPPVKGDKDA
ncbi:rab effector MyRIP [Nematolebias whitei]|uniref:rab effector MyRIP n=1 Tax=Nematolebias whitei TaxID=451745 RepID=UPI001897F230|nr:rab effector MyRIP [Nematolebias whitei]